MASPQFRAVKKQIASKSIHIGSEPQRWGHNEIVPPISLASTFKQEVPIEIPEFYYIREANPTTKSFELCLAAVENAKYCVSVSSGMAANALVKGLLEPGDHVVTQDDLYHGNFNSFKNLKKRNIEVDFVDATDPQNVAKVIRHSTKLVWLETPTNPLMKVVDIEAVVTEVRKRSKGAIILVDNTFMSPYFQSPIDFGVDVVMESCTKYIGGHSDILMGSLSTNDEELYRRMLKMRSSMGCVPSPFDCYLALRSLKTLEVRMKKHMSNALAIARFLNDHPAIEKVFHPGLESHPNHEVALKQCSGHSGIMSFYIKGHEQEKTERFLKKLKLIDIAESLGGLETTVKVPSLMPKGSLTPEEMDKQGITHGLVRISVGLEDEEDLIEDLNQALQL